MSNIELSEEVQMRLSQAAQATGRSPADLVTKAVMNLLDDIEDVAAADQVLADLAAGRSRTWSLEEVERDLGLASRVR